SEGEERKEEDKELALASGVWTECSCFFQRGAQHVRRCLLEAVLVPAVRQNHSNCTLLRNPPTVAAFPPSTQALCWTEMWGRSRLQR
ncbi:hypothetical protein GOODEAATRI_006838, partial [Goodea atripinnis]